MNGYSDNELDGFFVFYDKIRNGFVYDEEAASSFLSVLQSTQIQERISLDTARFLWAAPILVQWQGYAAERRRLIELKEKLLASAETIYSSIVEILGTTEYPEPLIDNVLDYASSHLEGISRDSDWIDAATFKEIWYLPTLFLWKEEHAESTKLTPNNDQLDHVGSSLFELYEERIGLP